jgi:hypothetical protein
VNSFSKNSSNSENSSIIASGVYRKVLTKKFLVVALLLTIFLASGLGVGIFLLIK